MRRHPAQSGHQTCPAVQTVVDVHDAKTHPSALIERAEAGEEIVITPAGQPIVKLVPLSEPQRRKFGGMTFDVPDDFDAPLDEEGLAAWE